MLIFGLYAVLLLIYGLMDARRSSNSSVFFLNGRSSGTWHTGFSLIASCIGGTATIGMAGLAWQIGTPAFWWLGSGACGLILLTLFLCRRIRESKAYTMPELVAFWLGNRARILVSVIIIPAWVAILAAQFTAMGKLTSAMTGMQPEFALMAGAMLIVIYSCLGGQASVIRSDLPQCLLLLASFFIVLLWLWMNDSSPLQALSIEMINKDFGLDKFSYFMLVMGGSYVVCPMLFGRILSSRDTKSAITGCWVAIIGLFCFSSLIVAAGVLCRSLVPPDANPDNVLVMAVNTLPAPAGMTLFAGLLSAVLSSADSCIITASTVCCNDILKRRDVKSVRAVTLFLGIGAFLLATRGHGILELLLMANNVYVYGVVGPVFIAMLARMRMRNCVPEAAILIGGVSGIISSVSGEAFAGYTGMVLSSMIMFGGMEKKITY